MSKLSLILILGVLLLFSLYLPLDVTRSNLYSFKTPLDNSIPLVTFFMTVYISYGIFLTFSLICFLKRPASQVLNIALLSIIISCLTSYSVYLFFQNSVDRPVIVPVNFFDRLYVWGNSWVAPYNAFPSLHVAISTICAIAFWKAKSKLFKLMLIWAILIIASTVLTKQHYFLDVLSGLVLGILSFKAASYSLRVKLM